MTTNFTSDEEKNDFLVLSNTIRSGNYEEALSLSKALLEKFPNNKALYHSQIGAMLYLANNDFWNATKHYSKALEYGFDADACEDNIWESAVDAYKFLIDSELGFSAIMYPDTEEFIAANNLIEKYQNLFPNGKFIEEAKELNYIFYLTRQLKDNNNYSSLALNQTYSSEYPNGKHNEIVAVLGEIIDKLS